jgi:ATP-dependent RNA helicase DHX33
LNLLLQYDVVVIDEAHERTLNTDFLCGALKKIQRIRRGLAGTNGNGVGSSGKGKGREAGGAVTELKIVVMSATLDPSKFVRFFETSVPSLYRGCRS